MRRKQRYEVLIEKKEACRVVVYAVTPEEAQEKALEEERRGNAESIGCMDVQNIEYTVL